MCNYSQLVKEEGRAEGRAEGEAAGKLETLARNIATLMEKKELSFEEAAELLNAPAEQWDDIRKEIKKQKAE